MIDFVDFLVVDYTTRYAIIIPLKLIGEHYMLKFFGEFLGFGFFIAVVLAYLVVFA